MARECPAERLLTPTSEVAVNRRSALALKPPGGKSFWKSALQHNYGPNGNAQLPCQRTVGFALASNSMGNQT